MAFIKREVIDFPPVLNRKSNRCYEDLIVNLNHDDIITRRWAARDLVSYPQASKSLLQRLKQEENVSVREVILTTLTRIGDHTSLQGLIDCLRSENTALRNEAIEAMKHFPDETGQIMEDLLKDEDPDVRIFAVNILESLRHASVEKWLIKVIETDENLNVCATALDLLCEVGTVDSIDPLARLRQRFEGDFYIQFAVDLACARIKGS